MRSTQKSMKIRVVTILTMPYTPVASRLTDVPL